MKENKDTKPKGDKMLMTSTKGAKALCIFTKEQVEAAKLVAVKKELKGTDHKFHNGGRGQIHEDKKRKAGEKKWSKRDLE